MIAAKTHVLIMFSFLLSMIVPVLRLWTVHRRQVRIIPSRTTCTARLWRTGTRTTRRSHQCITTRCVTSTFRYTKMMNRYSINIYPHPGLIMYVSGHNVLCCCPITYATLFLQNQSVSYFVEQNGTRQGISISQSGTSFHSVQYTRSGRCGEEME